MLRNYFLFSWLWNNETKNRQYFAKIMSHVGYLIIGRHWRCIADYMEALYASFTFSWKSQKTFYMGTNSWNITLASHIQVHRYIYIYIYIKWTVFVNVTTKSAQHACVDDCYDCWKKSKLNDVRDASLVCELNQFLTAWRLVLSMKPWSYIWLEFGLFQQLYILYIYISIYIYIYLYSEQESFSLTLIG